MTTATRATKAGALRHGARILQESTLDGFPVVIVEMDPQRKPALLDERAREDAADPWLRDFALRARRAVVRRLRDGASADDVAEAIARAFHRYVQREIAFVEETEEVFARAAYTLQVRAGDCDDHAQLLHAMLLAAGCRSELAVRWDDDRQWAAWLFAGDSIEGVPRDGLPVHVLPVVWHHGRWHWAETTIAAAYDESPSDAVERLGLTRDDLA